MGYDVQLVEYPVPLRKTTEIVKPDVVAASYSLAHAIVADCKSGNNIEGKQDDKYKKLMVADLHMVDVSDRKNLKHNVCYVDTDSNHSELEPHTTLPFITFKQDHIIGSGNFMPPELAEVLNKSTYLKDMKEPMGYYPFSPDDDAEDIIEHVMAGLISCLASKGQEVPIDVKNPEFMKEVLRRIYPIYEVISSVHRQELQRKIKKIIAICSQDSEFKGQLQKIQENGITAPTLKKMKRACTNIAEDYQKQKRITDKQFI